MVGLRMLKEITTCKACCVMAHRRMQFILPKMCRCQRRT
jgi:hypothetical protein